MSNILSTKPFDAQFIDASRAAGHAAGLGALERAEDEIPDFSKRALDFIVEHITQKGEVPGESVTLAAVDAGIKPPDQRAFGPVYAKALRRGLIHVVRYIPRVRGHGSAGGKLYAPGPDPHAVEA